MNEYLPDLPDAIHGIGELAHKADMIRTRLIARYGGMWLDSDALVMRDLNWLFDFLSEYDFVGFNTRGEITEERQGLSVNCFVARPRGEVVSRWVEAQNAKLEKREFRWGEIGTELLDPICLEHRTKVKMLRFQLICPVPWKEVRLFGSRWRTPRKTLNQAHVVMLSNYSLGKRYPQLRDMTINDFLNEDFYLSHFVKRARDPKYVLDPSYWAAFRFAAGKIGFPRSLRP